MVILKEHLEVLNLLCKAVDQLRQRKVCGRAIIA